MLSWIFFQRSQKIYYGHDVISIIKWPPSAERPVERQKLNRFGWVSGVQLDLLEKKWSAQSGKPFSDIYNIFLILKCKFQRFNLLFPK